MNNTLVSRRNFAALVISGIATVSTLLVIPQRAAHALEPLLSATVGTGSNTAYFVLDFQELGSSYAFAYKYNGAPAGDADGIPDGGDLLDALAGANIDFAFTATDFGGDLGRFVNGITYQGTSATGANDFSSLFWYWTSTDGQSWTEPPFGPDSQPLVNGGYTAYSWVGNTAGAFPPPVTPVAVTVPEAGTPLLLGLGAGLLGLGITIRRRSRTA